MRDGSGASGKQFASISFTNTGSTACILTGAPHAILLRGGAVLGSAATASDKRATPVTLTPGKAAESTLTDFSTCNAPNSDRVRISAPGQTASVDAPLVLRGCRLEIDPVSAVSD